MKEFLIDILNSYVLHCKHTAPESLKEHIDRLGNNDYKVVSYSEEDNVCTYLVASESRRKKLTLRFELTEKLYVKSISIE